MLLAAAACLTFLAPASRAAEHAAEKDKSVKACVECASACRQCGDKPCAHTCAVACDELW